jgi:hypothetical protein
MELQHWLEQQAGLKGSTPEIAIAACKEKEVDCIITILANTGALDSIFRQGARKLVTLALDEYSCAHRDTKPNNSTNEGVSSKSYDLPKTNRLDKVGDTGKLLDQTPRHFNLKLGVEILHHEEESHWGCTQELTPNQRKRALMKSMLKAVADSRRLKAKADKHTPPLHTFQSIDQEVSPNKQDVANAGGGSSNTSTPPIEPGPPCPPVLPHPADSLTLVHVTTVQDVWSKVRSGGQKAEEKLGVLLLKAFLDVVPEAKTVR